MAKITIEAIEVAAIFQRLSLSVTKQFNTRENLGKSPYLLVAESINRLIEAKTPEEHQR